ncbi:hypothetical protein RD792_010447 [Penstemon davidsonii]|uniref:Fe2OG dioxygenase domain-containing protein n=1 Tax=Penstemon davidsonii TaxID=160366 RepID=A0ABR0D1V5_9LAMI|nr:hypothetical protein RD792_010447 [Penstemon davidsonii]
MEDPFLLIYSAAELRIAAEFLSNWLPFLTRGLCNSCAQILSNRVQSFNTGDNSSVSTPGIIDLNHCKEGGSNCSTHFIGSRNNSVDNDDNADAHSLGSWKDEAEGLSEHASRLSLIGETCSSPAPLASPGSKKSWADMTQEDELVEEEENDVGSEILNLNDTFGEGTSPNKARPNLALLTDQREYIQFRSVKRQKDFICLERVNGKFANILDGLELYTGVFSAAEQKRIVKYVEQLQEMGRNGKLKERTYSAPQKWMRGKGRVTLQFGCCYNYATDKNGNPPGIIKNETVDPLPSMFKVMIKRLVRWHVLPPSCVPDSCIVNIYDEGDCIPPHIDNHDFVRPFCTVSFLSECEIVFGSNLKIVGPGEFAGSFPIPLPVGSVLVINGNGADIAKHCVPAVPTKRISITFRKMDESKWPVGYVPEPDLQGLEPISDEVGKSKNYNGSRNRRFFSKPAGGRDERVETHYSGRFRQDYNNNRERFRVKSKIYEPSST